MTYDFELYNNLKDHVESDHTVIDFFNFCELHRKIHGKSHPLCYYKVLLTCVALDKKISKQEEDRLVQLYIKYGEVDIEYILMCDPEYNPLSEKSINRDFKYVYNKISEGAKIKNYNALSEICKLLRNNLDFSYNNRGNAPIYDSDAQDELQQICNEFTEQKFMISDSDYVRLTPRALIHIITGHTEENKIPRKGLLSNLKNNIKWCEIVDLIHRIVKHKASDIALSLSERNRYDCKAILFEGDTYGLHIHKNRSISSFYPVLNYNI